MSDYQRHNMFDAKKVAADCIKWIHDYFENGSRGCNAIIGISGGKDSSIAAALCVKALGADRVIGVMMPQGEQSDISYSIELCELLQIKSYTVNIGKTAEQMIKTLEESIGTELTNQARINIPPRLRMTALYSICACNNGRVVNTCNLSEDYIGYSTKFGDAAGDFSPLSHLTVNEVRAVGYAIGLPAKFIDKVPSDGLCGKTDEDNLGFTYAMLDRYIREGVCENEEIKKRIDRLHIINLHKLLPMPSFDG